MAGLLAACGGGGDDEAGAPVALNIQPTTITLTALAAASGGPPAGTCGTQTDVSAGLVYIFGGAAPYKLKNTAPDRVMLDKEEVGDRNGSFSVTYLQNGGCFDPVLIVVVDKLNNQVTLTLSNKPAS